MAFVCVKGLKILRDMKANVLTIFYHCYYTRDEKKYTKLSSWEYW